MKHKNCTNTRKNTNQIKQKQYSRKSSRKTYYGRCLKP